MSAPKRPYNPYAAPQLTEAGACTEAAPTDVVDFRVIMKRWEYLRIFYNLILVAVTVAATLLLQPTEFLHPALMQSVFTGGIIANVAYFAGPLVEGYASSLRLWREGFFITVFVLGTILNCLLAVGCVAVYHTLGAANI